MKSTNPVHQSIYKHPYVTNLKRIWISGLVQWSTGPSSSGFYFFFSKWEIWISGLDHWITGLVRSGPEEIEKKIERPPLERCHQSDRSVRPVQTGPDHWITGLVRSGPDEIEKKNWETPPRKTPSTGPVRPSSSNWTGPLDHWTGPVRSSSNWTGPLDHWTGPVQFKLDQTTRSLDWTENRNVDSIDNINKIKLFYYVEYLN